MFHRDDDLRLRESEEDGGTTLVVEPLFEDQSVLLPSGAAGGGVVRADGTIKIAVIRPCVSRGKRVRGLPPIYTPRMLQEHAAIFTGWPMFMDHVTEEMQEALRKRGRSVTELGGRIVESWWDPTFTHPEDSKFGFQPGAVLAYALPQPASRAMIEADPEILRCSINAWPTGASPGKAPWNGKDGMLIEGISEEPPGSVDWVIRAGAGGRVLQEAETFAVCAIERAYSAAHEQEHEVNLFDGKTPEEIREYLRENHPGVLETPAASAPLKESGDDAVATLTQLLEKHEEQILSKVGALLEEHTSTEEERIAEELEARDTARGLETKAHKLIEGAEGLTPGWKAELKAKYTVLPSGPSRALALLESDEDGTAEDKLRESIEADVERALELIGETKPEPRPHGLGGGEGLEEGTEGTPKVPAKGENEFIDYLVESGMAADPAEAVTKMREAVTG